MDEPVEEMLSLCVPSIKAQLLRAELEKLHLWDRTRRLQKIDAHSVAIPVKGAQKDLIPVLEAWPCAQINRFSLPPSKSKLLVKPYERLVVAVSSLIERNNLSESLLEEVPRKWEWHGDLVLIPSCAFTSPLWLNLGQDLWTTVATALSCKRIARHSPVADNGYRSSQVTLLLGSDGKVVHTDNAIKYSYDVTKCMFSVGNITEKLRVAQLNCLNEVVVDLFAGIGYFTLPYLVHAKAQHVHACEWNPDAVAALRQNLSLNQVAPRCTIHQGDNRKLPLKDIADRVNLGLIPSSHDSWSVAAKVLKPSGGFLHVHDNVTTSQSSPLRCHSKDSEKSSEEVVEISYLTSSSCHSPLDTSENEACGETRETDNGGTYLLTNQCRESSLELSFDKSIAVSPILTKWASGVASEFLGLFHDLKGGRWTVRVCHIEKVKSYAPHIDHMVIDLECRPKR